VEPKALRMDLVDGHVKVFVVLVVVAGGNVLVLRKSQGVHEAFHNMAEFLALKASIFWVKRDDKMVGAVLACAGILRLDGLDQVAGELDVVGGGYAGEVGGEEPCCSRVVALATPQPIAPLLDSPCGRFREARRAAGSGRPARRRLLESRASAGRPPGSDLHEPAPPR